MTIKHQLTTDIFKRVLDFVQSKENIGKGPGQAFGQELLTIKNAEMIKVSSAGPSSNYIFETELQACIDCAETMNAINQIVSIIMIK